MPITVATVNVNGLRAAMRNGMGAWLQEAKPDIVAMQEVRAPDDMIQDLLGDDWHVVHAEASLKGRAGVAVASRTPSTKHRVDIGVARFVGTGRWIETTFNTSDKRGLTIISAYIHAGDETKPEKMEEKLAFLDAVLKRLRKLQATGQHVLYTGDLNVAHKEVDIKNWKGNRAMAGFLPEERAHFDKLLTKHGWIDLGRQHGGEGPGPYTWWSYRGKAFDNDSGWRIDYQIATPELAATAKDVSVHRARSYAQRWSDHAPVVATFDI